MIDLIEVRLEEKEVLYNLIEKYQYEFSQWEKTDVNENGMYGYEYLDCYFTEKNRYPYFIKVDGKLAGFIMVSDYPEVPEYKTDYCISEFFIMYKYRRSGVGSDSVYKVLDLHHGKWQLKRHPHNMASVHFWNNVINKYTEGNYKLVESYPNREVDYDDGTPADVLFFEN